MSDDLNEDGDKGSSNSVNIYNVLNNFKNVLISNNNKNDRSHDKEICILTDNEDGNCPSTDSIILQYENNDIGLVVGNIEDSEGNLYSDKSKRSLTRKIFIASYCLISAGILLSSFFPSFMNKIENNPLDHYTEWMNWYFIFSYILYGIIAIIDKGSYLTLIAYTLGILPSICLSCNIFIGMFLVYNQNPDMLLRNTKIGGGEHDAGLVFSINEIIHSLPIILSLLLTIMDIEYIIKSINHKDAKYWWSSAIIPITFITVLYVILFDFMSVYGVNISDTLAVILVITFSMVLSLSMWISLRALVHFINNN